MNHIRSVNVFHGNSILRLPNAAGLAAKWKPFKGQAGNTNPAAVLPFGKYSVCAYTGGYPTGYGLCKPNSGEPIQSMSGPARALGFSHLHQSGTGGIRVYYNYAVVTPFLSQPLPEGALLTQEQADPGFYSAILAEENIRAELTVSKYAAYHRYTFPQGEGRIRVDLINDGLSKQFSSAFFSEGSDLQLEIASPTRLLASVTLQGVRLYFVVSFETESDREALHGELDDGGCFCLSSNEAVKKPLPAAVIVRVSFSASSMDDALRENDQALAVSFDNARSDAETCWEEALSRIEIDCTDPVERTLFYSNYYHSLIKPSDWGGGGFLWEGAPFVVDFATFWDVYKTALPFIYTFYPETSAHIVAMLQKTGQTLGQIPNTILLSSNTSLESAQARMLAQYSLYDAWKRQVSADWAAAAQVLANCSDNEEFRRFEQTGHASRATHTLDLSEASQCAAELCRAYGLNEEAARFEAMKDAWKNAFDPETGLLTQNSEYYEGNYRNYSFRLFRDMPGRIALAGGREAFLEQLDHFFGFCGNDACFEGFNNETDMEAPFCYHALGAFDRLQTIWETADRLIFRNANGASGPDALPGNNDSGALSTCYLWNTLGLFPVSGQDKMLITRPKFRQSLLHLASGNDLTILREGEGTVPVSACLNGKELKDLSMTVSEMMNGGILRIQVQ